MMSKNRFFEDRAKIRTGILALAVLIGLLSLYYTQRLVSELAQREHAQIDLFAKALQYVATSSDASNLNFLLKELISPNNSIPVILTDSDDVPIESRNIDLSHCDNLADTTEYLKKRVKRMKDEKEPIHFSLVEGIEQRIYYEDSALVKGLQYFPYIQLSVIAIFMLLAYMIFNTDKRSEQNRIWAGLAKETAHQLGTPISGLIAWVEYLKTEGYTDPEITKEMSDDLQRLQTITERFSMIGSQPVFKNENINQVFRETLAYLSKRLSQKVNIVLEIDTDEDPKISLNRSLFEWVIENLVKNAVDAMAGAGELRVSLRIAPEGRMVQIDISDNGKGIALSNFQKIFQAGYTTKKRGWGLGLTLVKRIVEGYHAGQIFVLKSEPNICTTFRILLPNKPAVVSLKTSPKDSVL